MLTKVELKNFRGFDNLALDLKPVSVVVGPNSSGKTTALHAISVALRAYSIVLDDPTTHPVAKGADVKVCSGLILRDHTPLLPLAERNELFRNGTVFEGATSTITLTFDGPPVESLSVSLAYMRNAVLKLTVAIRSSAAAAAVTGIPTRSKNRPTTLLDVLRKERPAAVLVPAFYGVTTNEEFRARPVVDELLQAGQQSTIVRNLVSRLSANDFTELNAFLTRTLGARIEARTTAADAETTNPIIVRFSDSNGALDLSAAGAGLVNLVALFSALKFRQLTAQAPTVFLFDEPEAHLHPKLQGLIGDELATIVRSFSNAQLVIATHSVEMINRLGRRDDAVLYAVDRTTGAAKLDSESGITDALSAWADLTPFTSLNFLASRRLLFHEGPSDATILTRCAEAYFANDPVKLVAFRRWTLVPLDGSGNAPALKTLEKVIQPKVFPNLSLGGAVRLVLLIDRDRSRKPGETKSTNGNVASSQIVWSRNSIESLFLDPAALAIWLAASIPPGGTPESTIQQHVTAAVATVDANQELLDTAIGDLQTELLKPGGLKVADALKQATSTVRTEPAVWQKGRDRARRVLEAVRGNLAHSERRHVRGTLADQLGEADLPRLSNPVAAIPSEVRTLLDSLVT